jgi:hypothetical protein
MFLSRSKVRFRAPQNSQGQGLGELAMLPNHWTHSIFAVFTHR